LSANTDAESEEPGDGQQSRRVLLPGLALMALACIALAGLAVYQVRWIAPELERIQDDVAQSFEVIKAARSLERTLAGAERSERNYLITEDPELLNRYRDFARQSPALVWKLRRLAVDRPEQASRIPELEKQVDAALAQMKRIHEAYQRRGADGGRRELRGHLDNDSMRRLSSLIDDVVTAEDTRLAQLQTRASRHEETFAAVALAAGLLAITVMALGILQLVQAFRSARQSAEARYISEARFRLFVSGVVDYAVYTMDTEGRVTSWNAGAQRIKQYTEREILGRNFARFYTAEAQKAGVPRTALETAAREGRYESEAQRVRKDGSVFWAHVVLDPIRDGAGRLLGYVKVTRDVTEQRAQKEALEQARAALAQAQKMEALGQLTGGVAHDFNNLLTVILGSLETLEMRLKAGRQDVAKFVETARRGADRAADLVARLLAFARRQPLEPRPVNPNALVNGVVTLMRRALSESISVETVLAAGAWWVSADRSQLENAVLNLVLNARDAMPRGGRLTLETANAFLDEAYASVHEDLAPGQYAMIAVSDTGMGMTREQVARAFEPFYTTKDAGQGSGLGLSQVYGFVKQSHGHVKLYSEPGTGTVVKLYLPRHEGPPPEEAPATQAVERTTGVETILLVEDDEDVRRFAAESLGELGYRVLQAGDARAALELLGTGEAVDLLVTDVGLPNGVNGRQLAEAALKRKPALKVLFTSGYARNAIVHHGVLDAGVQFIGKPFTQSSLARRVREILDRPAVVPA